MSELKNIVIIGASNAGHSLAKKLVQEGKIPETHRILLIDPAQFAYWPIASLRASVVPGWEKKVYRELKQEGIFAEGTKHVLVQAKVEEVGDGRFVLDREFEGTREVTFDSLVFATGASQPFPMRPKQEWSIAEVEDRLRQTQEDIAAAERVVIIGGGPTGIEMAGEIITAHPSKKITLVHRQPRLLDDRFPVKLSNQLEALLKKAGVELVLGDEHIQEPDLVTGKQDVTRTIRTKNGKELEGEFVSRSRMCLRADRAAMTADYVFIAIGNQPNTQLLANADPAALSKDKTINVNEFLQVQSSLFPRGNVFAAGDCANSPGWRSYISVEADIATLARNIPAQLSGSAMKKHAPGPRAMVVPVGPAAGAGFAAMGPLGDTALPQFAVPIVKGKDLFVSKFFARFLT
ncbi:hypothetical protein QFC19_001613 [Naganishia cerealis]|uniref:Uncharacterized protein n=1 Tax=Naganishia cerealis TaxID=610337 RepID=A0ACC2WHF4_9TREE|nr:hypothetical protein QFC19_001613 [Naganishia cerealis]